MSNLPVIVITLVALAIAGAVIALELVGPKDSMSDEPTRKWWTPQGVWLIGIVLAVAVLLAYIEFSLSPLHR